MDRPPIRSARRRRPASAAVAAPREAAPEPSRLWALLPLLAALVALLVAAGCRVAEDDAPAPAEPAAAPSAEPEVRASVPIEGYREVDLARLEAERLDDSWRSFAERDRRSQGAADDPARETTGGAPERSTGDTTAVAGRPTGSDPGAGAPVERMRGAGDSSTGPGTPAPSSGRAGEARAGAGAGSSAAESWDDLSPDAFTDFAPRFPIPREGGGPTVLALQRLLDRVRFSPGVIDGRWGKNTEKAVYWLQDALGLAATGARPTAPCGTVWSPRWARARRCVATG